jgi:hypothetical protein
MYNNVQHTHTQEKNMSSGNKSGFEIRADLLGQAQGILELNIQRRNDAIHSHNDSFPTDKKPLVAEVVTAQEVISVAKELYEFVNKQ